MKKTILTVALGSIACFAFASNELSMGNKLDLKLATFNESQVTEGTRTALRRAKTIWGPTGLIFIPTAYTAGKGEFSWGASITKDFSSGSVSYGLIDDIEVGVTYLDRRGADNKSIANAKVHIVPSNFDWFEIGVGVMDVADAVNQTVYFVGSADVIVPDYAAERGAVGLRLHAGVGTGYFSEKPFFGGELLFDRGFSLLGEWDTKNTNFGVRYAHDDEFFVELGNYASRLAFKMSYTMRF
ncbi:YjbH domain-containing protein [Kamptonema cortianum]|nr:YjbH domain-containing protein [Geitlerinema splendidum]MDK3160998.1 YjbH domain-containing protein [Kamptonema cortianum]